MPDLLGTPRAAEMLGISPDQFRRLVAKTGIEPAGWYRNPHYRSGPPCPLWRPEDVESLRPVAEAVQRRTETRRQAASDLEAKRRARFERRYASWRDALSAAAEAMFNLNRYAKHGSCRRDHRDEIYELKNRFLRLLYEEGACVSAGLHVEPGWNEECWRCGGGGIDPDDGEDCRKCLGTGVWRRRKKRRYIVFRFRIGEKTYCWHQPKELVVWPVEFTASKEEVVLELEERPVALPPRKFAEAKALLRWVLEAAAGRGDDGTAGGTARPVAALGSAGVETG